MNKFITKIVGAALGLTLAIGVGVAVGANQSDSREVSAIDTTFLPSDFDAASSTDFSKTIGTVTISVTASTVNSDEIRIYKNQTITISSTGSITSIVFTCTANGTTKYGPGCFGSLAGYTFEDAGPTGTWTGNASSISLTASSNQVRCTSIVVTEASSFGTLDHIKITTAPTKTDFVVGDTFDKTGMIVTAYDGANEATAKSKAVTGYRCGNGTTANYYDGRKLTSDDKGSKTVTVSYTESEITATATYSISVTEPIAVTGVSLNKNSATINIGATDTLTATVEPANASNKNVAWTSSDNGVATVALGVVTGVSAGEATITVTTVDGSKTATCTVTVVAAKYYEITEVSQLAVGKNYLLGTSSKVIGTTQNTNNRAAVNIGDADANGLYTFASTFQNIVLGGEFGAYTLYASNGSNTGYLYAPSESSNHLKTRAQNSDDKSTWNITHDGSGWVILCCNESVHGDMSYNTFGIFACYTSGEYYMHIYREFVESEVVSLTGLSFSEGSSGTYYAGEEFELTPVYTPSNATYKAVEWASSNTSAATVENGVVTAVAAGSTTITATSAVNNEIYAEYALTVKAMPIFKLVSAQSDLFEGATVALLTSGGIVATGMNASNYLETTAATADSGGYKHASTMIFTVRIYNDKIALQYGTQFLYYDGAGNDVSLATTTLTSASVGYTWTLDATGLKSNPGRYLRYNSGSPRFACYDNEYAAVKLYKATDSLIDAESRANTFIYKELHMRDIDVTNVTKGTDCKGNEGYYAKAKAVWNSDGFADSRSYVLGNVNAAARLNAWAEANGESIDENTKILGVFNYSQQEFTKESSSTIAIVVISSISLVAVSSYFVIRRRREN